MVSNKKVKNDQYAYTSESDISLSIDRKDIDKGWILIKNGLTIEQTVEKRVRQQDIASTTSDLVVVSTITCDSPDTKLDDKIRAYMYKYDQNFQDYKRDSGKKNEWSLVNINSILKKLKINLTIDILKNKEFLKRLDKLIFNAKKKAIRALLGQRASKIITLRPHQKDSLKRLVKANMKYNLLSFAPRYGKTYFILEFAPRYGKTYFILEYVRLLAEKHSNIILVIASKNLSSNESFLADAKGYEYPFEILTVSLFKDETKLIQSLSSVDSKLTKKHKVVLVTDEADRGSHTNSSIKVLNHIKNDFNMIKQVVMSGTGIYKADKIFRDIPAKQVYTDVVTYTDLLVNDAKCKKSFIVKRNWIDINLNMGKDEDKLNIVQSFADPDKHEYMGEWIDNIIKSQRYGGYSKAIMIFCSTKNNKHLKSFYDNFSRAYSSKYETLLINSTNTSNKKAQRDTLEKLNVMGKNVSTKDKQLVIFSRQMADRSYSIPDINKVIVMKDGQLSSADYQRFSRALTWEEGKEIADLIRISFEDLTLSADIFLEENPYLVDLNKTQLTETASTFWNYNTFASFNVDDEKNLRAIYEGEPLDMYLDRVMKRTDNIKRIVGRLYHNYDEYDFDAIPRTHRRKITQSNRTKEQKYKNNKKKYTNEVSTAVIQLEIEAYVEALRTIPVVADISFGIDNIKDLMNVPKEKWNDAFSISHDKFLKNLEVGDLHATVKFMFRQYNQVQRLEKLQELFDNI